MRDRNAERGGYWPSLWPVECGGNRRQKAAHGALDAATGHPLVTTNRNGRWNVMVVLREPGEVFLAGTMAAFSGAPPYGWVQRLDAESMEPAADTGELPCGDHVWCGAVLVHTNGDLYNVNGSFVHRVDADCKVVLERELPADRAHNGLLALSDGSLVTKDLRLEGQGRSTITRLDAESLELLGDPIELPEGSMGRIAADINADGEYVYVPGTEHLIRVSVDSEGWSVDDDYAPRYRNAGTQQGLAWDSCISDDNAWIMDNGDIQGVRAIFGQHPNGRFGDVPPRQLSWQHPAPWTGAQRLLRVGLDDGAVAAVAPFDRPGGGIIAPPVHVPEHRVTICWDSINGGLAGVFEDDMSVAWRHDDIRPTMQPVVFPDSGEVVINDFVDGRDDLIVFDAASGDVVSRVVTGSTLANGMFLTPGGERDVYYCSTLTVTRVQWA